jgi:FKBP-type peptidyl-prolyl cis-trans isomerase
MVIPVNEVSARDSGDWSTPGLAETEDTSAPPFKKLPSGVVVQNLIEGTGVRGAAAGDTLLVDYVLRRANGYFIYSTMEGISFQPSSVPTGAAKWTLDETLLPGLVEGMAGMKKSGRRRILVPPDMGYQGSAKVPSMPTFATSRQLENHKQEPLVFEVEVINIQENKARN